MSGQRIITPSWLNTQTKVIQDSVKAADGELLKAAKLLVEIKANFDQGVFTKLTWRAWLTEELSIGDRRVRELLRIGRAESPAAELALQRAANKARQQRHRVAKAQRASPGPRLQSTGIASAPEMPKTERETSDGAKALIAWATNASAEQIDAVLAFIAEFDLTR